MKRMEPYTETANGAGDKKPPAQSPEDSPLYQRMAVVCHAVIILYSAAFWIQVGVMPFLSKKLGANPVVFGYIETVFAIAMLIGGPLFGRFGDLFGARAALCVAFLSSFLTYTVLAFATSIEALFISRLFAFMMHAMHGAQMVMTDVSGTVKRADALGKLGVSYGIGMIIGPTIGGFVTSYFNRLLATEENVGVGERYAASLAAMICLVAIAIVLAFVPRTTKDPKRIAAADSKENKVYESGSVFNLKVVVSLLRIPAVLYVVVLKAVVGVPAGVFHSMFTIVNMERFGLTPESNGPLLSYVGVLTGLMQAFGVRFFSRRFTDPTLLRASIVLMSFSYLLLSFANSLLILALILVPMVMAGALLNTIANGTITKQVPETATGTSLGLSMATHSIIRAVSPTVGGYMVALFGFPSFGILGFVMNGGLAVYVLLSGRDGTMLA